MLSKKLNLCCADSKVVLIGLGNLKRKHSTESKFLEKYELDKIYNKMFCF